MAKRTVPASNFMATVAANVDNLKMTDAAFRQFIRNSLPVVEYEGCDDDPRDFVVRGYENQGPYGYGNQDR